MQELFDETDRAISAALLRNGRASWRLISKVTGIQERTVSRRGTRLLESGRVRVQALSQPHLVDRGEGYFARIKCPPAVLRPLARWLSHRDETLWVATLASESAIVSECYFREEDRGDFIERELAEFAITDYAFANIDRYRRTVRGWHPNALTAEQLEQLGESEEHALTVANREPSPDDPLPDAMDYEIVRILNADGRLPIDAIATELGITKPTVRRRIAHLQQTDFLSIRAVIDPALFGLSLEVLITVDSSAAGLGPVASQLAKDWRVRWAAEVPACSQVQALVTLSNRYEMYAMLRDLEDQLDGLARRIRAHPILTHYKRSDVILPVAFDEPQAL